MLRHPENAYGVPSVPIQCSLQPFHRADTSVGQVELATARELKGSWFYVQGWLLRGLKMVPAKAANLEPLSSALRSLIPKAWAIIKYLNGILPYGHCLILLLCVSLAKTVLAGDL